MTQPESAAGDLIAGQLSTQLAALAARVETGNRPGDLDGLFARHVLHDTETTITWNVDPPTDNRHADTDLPLRHAPALAGAGYTLHHAGRYADTNTRDRIAAGLTELMRRDPFPTDGVTFVHDPRQLLGVALAVGGVREVVPQAHGWLSHVIDDPRLRAAAPHTDLVRLHVQGLLADEPVLLPDAPGRDANVLATICSPRSNTTAPSFWLHRSTGRDAGRRRKNSSAA